MSDQAVATATAWSPGHCESVDLWSPDVKAGYTFRAPGPCPRTSTGQGIASAEFDRGGLAWTTGRHVCFTVRSYVESPNVRAPGC